METPSEEEKSSDRKRKAESSESYSNPDDALEAFKREIENTENTLKENLDAQSDEVDISTPCWFYQDPNGSKQGPFSFKEMFLWWKGNYFTNELLVKTIWEDQFQPLGNIPEFYNAPTRLVERIEREQDELVRQGAFELPEAPIYNPNAAPAKQVKYEEYSVKGGFSKTGQFQGNSLEGYFARQGLPADKELRYINEYMDVKNLADGIEKKKLKKPKLSKKFWKERKEKKRRDKLVAEYLADDR